MTSTQRKAILDAWSRINDLCGSSTDDSRLWDAINDATIKQEREHRAMGARFTNQTTAAMYSEPAKLAARYFAVKVVLEAPRKRRVTWLEATQLRDDYRLGHALRESLLARPLPTTPHVWPLLAVGRPCIEREFGPAVLSVDYGKSIARHDSASAEAV